MLDDHRSVRTGAVCGLLAVIAFSVLYSLAASRDPGYEFLDDYLSDLGVGPAAWAFNSALMLSGALIAVFAFLGLRPILGSPVPSRAGTASLGVSGLLLMNVGVFTEDSGDTHFAFSIAFFLVLLVALGLLAYAFWETEALGRTGWAVSGSAFSFGLLLLAIGLNPLTETLAVMAAVTWGGVVSVRMLLAPRNDKAP